MLVCLSYPPTATEVTSHALSSPQFGIISSVTSYLREWVSRLACVVKGYICLAGSTALPSETGYLKPEQCKESVWRYYNHLAEVTPHKVFSIQGVILRRIWILSGFLSLRR